MRKHVTFLGLLLAACADDPSALAPPPTVAPASSSSGADDPTTSFGPGSDASTSTSSTSGAAEPESGGTTCAFICEPDAGTGTNECDPFAQDCNPGEKCMPWANDGGSSWNATRCTPIAEDPGQPGDPCTVEGTGVSGLDDCDLGSMCWDVDPETNAGTCVPMCTGDAGNPICEDPDTSCSITNDGALVLCLPVCDPLLQDCAEGQACYPVNDGWSCAPDASGEMGAHGDPCEYLNVCDPGLVCLDASVVPMCEGMLGCCSSVCDVSDPAGDAQCVGASETCQPWYPEDSAPPGLEDVGACALPG